MSTNATAKIGVSHKTDEVGVVLDDGLVRLSISKSKEIILTELITGAAVRIRPNSYNGGGFSLITSDLVQPVSVNGKVEWNITSR